MKDRKQEAIEILRELTVWDIQSEGYPNLEEFYNRIAPYIRGEFPREEILKILRGVYHHSGFDARHYLPSGAAESIKELWECQTYGERREAYKPVQLDPLRGKGEERLKPEHSLGDTMKDRRSGEERRKVLMQDPHIRTHSIKLSPKEKVTIWGPDWLPGDGSFIFRDRRTLPNRRKC